MTKIDANIKVRHEPMRIAGKKVDAEETVAVRYPYTGAVVGTVLLYMLPFVLSPLIGHHHALVFGIFMVLVVMFQPKGLIGMWLKWSARPRGGRASAPIAAAVTDRPDQASEGRA